MNSNKTEFLYFQQNGAISTLSGKPLKLVSQFIHLGSNISSTKFDISIPIGKVWTAIDRLFMIGRSDLSDKIKQEFFQVVAMSVLLYDCTR